MRPMIAAPSLCTSLLCLALALPGAPLAAQNAPRSAPGPGAAAAKGAPPKGMPAKGGEGLTGSYAGTATVQLGDSTIVVPVSYLFSGTAPSITGTAMVPGQGSGTISNVARDGAKVRFRVTAGEGKLLEHDGTVAANGSIDGWVNLDGKPVAKFRIAPGTLPAKPAAGGTPAVKPKGR